MNLSLDFEAQSVIIRSLFTYVITSTSVLTPQSVCYHLNQYVITSISSKKSSPDGRVANQYVQFSINELVHGDTK